MAWITCFKQKLFEILISTATLYLQSKYSVHFAHYLGIIFINRERIALLESKFYF